MMRKSVCIADMVTVMIAMVLLLAGTPNVTANTQQAASATTEVKIDNFSFGPGTLTVTVGTTVTWTNRDDIPHTVVSTDGAFKSNLLDSSEDDRQGHRAVSEERPCIHSTSKRRCLRNTRNTWS